MKKMTRVLIIVAVIIALIIAGKNIILKAAVEGGVKAATGLSINMKKFDLSILKSHVSIEGLKLLNPEGFPEDLMFHAPEIFVDYNLGDIVKGNIHIEDIRLNFDEFVIIKNAQGRTNLEALKPDKKEGASKKDSKKPQVKADKKKGKKALKIQIDHVVLKVGKVVYKDYSKGGDPIIKEYNVNISEEFNDITNIRSLLGIIAMKAMAKTALGDLTGFNVDILKDAIAVPEQAVESLKGVAESIKNIKLPFGSRK